MRLRKDQMPVLLKVTAMTLPYSVAYLNGMWVVIKPMSSNVTAIVEALRVSKYSYLMPLIFSWLILSNYFC